LYGRLTAPQPVKQLLSGNRKKCKWAWLVRSRLEPGSGTGVVVTVMNLTALWRAAAVQCCTQAHCLMPGSRTGWCADGCDGVSLGKHFPEFRSIFLGVSSGPLGREGKGKSFLRNITQRYTASLPGRFESSRSNCFETAVQAQCRTHRRHCA